jgi:all-trans-8'-apo-beta-carotenal 15,15'-oxygenase
MTLDSPRATRPAHPLFVPFEGPVREHAFQPLRVEGAVPVDLQGTLYRNGPGTFGVPGVSHWFDGPGVLTAVRLGGGQAQGAVRHLRTPDLVRAEQSGRPGMRYHYPGSWLDRLRALAGRGGSDNLANINVIGWQGQLLALFEAAPAIAVDPETLAVIGPFDGGGLVPSLQAHPHRVASHRTTYHIGLRVGRESFVDLYAFHDDGPITRLAAVQVPGANEIHDFFVTERHAVLMLAPLWGGPLDLLRSGFSQGLRWQPELGNEIVVIPLHDPSRLVRFRAPPSFFWHQANAWDEPDGRIGLEWVGYPDFSTSQQLEHMRRGEDSPTQSALWRALVDPRTERFDAERVLDRGVEFPWVHDAVVGKRHRFTWLGTHSEGAARQGWFDRWLVRDAVTGEVTEIDPGPDRAVGEPILVPRSEEERDAWMLSFVRDPASQTAHLAIYDGLRPQEGPVARLWFDQMLPHSLHGQWVPSRR